MSGRRGSYSVDVPRGYRIGAWRVLEPLASGAFGSVYAAERRRDGAEAEADGERTSRDGAPGAEKADQGPDTGPAASGGGRGSAHRPADPPPTAALKFLPTGTCTPRRLSHLQKLADREVALLRRLRSPRLIRLYETLTVDDPAHPELDGATVLVLERAAGSLADLLAGAERPPAEGPVLLTQVCEGLRQLHGAGWVHGDLKPANVLLMQDGSVRLADFNMAAELEGSHAYSPAFATPDYTPPELLWPEVDERGTRIRPSADIWAFGVLAHVVLTGAHPLPGGTSAVRREAGVRYARGTEELRLSAGLPDAWRGIVRDCLSPTHRDRARYDAASLLPRVRQAADGPAPAGESPWPLMKPRGSPSAARRTRVRALLALTGVAALTALGLGLGSNSPPAVDGSPPAKRPATAGPAADHREQHAKTGSPTASAQPVGYDRCLPGDVCFFTGRDGTGAMCAWEGDDTDWARGETTCSWAGKRDALSVFNNGHDTTQGEIFIDVVYFARDSLRDRLGCVEVGTRHNLPTPLRPMSHRWTEHC
ncbi:protein kinase domain-containing protein [Streptomyces sp. MS06]|uniref:protein kinase domain-containing protein n=1 Tax=Streptomyces sp. MS06 TaxID=3385974 RepID=UPI0039A0F3A7